MTRNRKQQITGQELPAGTSMANRARRVPSPSRFFSSWILLQMVLASVLFVAGCGGEGDKNGGEQAEKKIANGTKLKKSTAGSAFKVDISNLPSKKPKADFQTGLQFTEVQDSLGLDFKYQNGQEGQSLMVETTGGGNAWLDYDRDGNMDVYFCQAGDATRGPADDQLNDDMFRQLSDGTFDPVIGFAGIVDRNYSQGVSVGDFDSDGFADIYVTNCGKNSLWKNMGDGSFLEVTTEAKVADGKRWSSTSAWADLDLDGDLDLYVCNYTKYDRFNPHPCLDKAGNPAICHPKHVDAWPDACYINNGDGTFVEQSQARGLFGPGNKGLGVAIADFNRDGFPDVYVANDTTANFMFINDGNARFQEMGGSLGCSVDRAGSFQASMGLGVYDYDQDGYLDIYSTHYEEESNTLYRNLGDRGFQDVTAIVDLHTPTVPWLGFGTIMSDFDFDGQADIFIAHGHVNNTPTYYGKQKMEAGLFSYDGDFFHEVTSEGGDYFKHKYVGRGVSSCDYDNDGDLDLLVSHQNDPAVLLRNDSRKGHFLKFQFVGTESNREGIGVQVTVVAGDQRYFHELVGGTSYVCSNQPVLVFGLGDYSEPVDVEIRWPTGEVKKLQSVAVDSAMVIVEGSDS